MATLVYNENLLGATNVLFIDSACAEAQLFYDSCNANTFPIIYSSSAGTDELLQLLASKFSKIERIAFVFHDPQNYTKRFINNNDFFSMEDISELNAEDHEFSQNFVLLQNIIRQFGVVNVDFLACNAFKHSSWKDYFTLLNSKTSVIVGASSNETGNTVESDWTMESTGENIKPVYFTSSIDAFSGVLAIVQANTIYITQLGTNLQYSTDNVTFATITFPFTISAGNSGTCLCKLITNLNITNVGTYIKIGSAGVTIDGQGYIVNIDGITSGYAGFIQNGIGTSTGWKNVTIQNIGVTTSNGSTLVDSAGWLCQEQFGNSIANGNILVQNCYSTGGGGYYTGGILGLNVGARLMSGGVISIINCYSTGQIGPGNGCGGILGGGGGYYMTGGTISVTNCYSTGNISNYCGGIFGGFAGRGTTGGNVSATNCYSIGTIGQTNAGGIFGRTPGYGAKAGLPSNTITANTVSCFGANIFAADKNANVCSTVNPTYVNTGVWSNTNANAVLTGYPISPSLQGTVWMQTNSSGTTPYLLTSFAPPCFKSGTKILTNHGYKQIETLKNGDIVKTLLNGYKPIFLIGKKEIYHVASNERIKEQLYEYSSNKIDELFEPLVLTGAHAVLVDSFVSEKQRERVVETLGEIFVTDDKYRLPACADERASVYKGEGTYTIYHLALENDNYYWNYGIYANGLLVESCSKRYLQELSNMELID